MAGTAEQQQWLQEDHQRIVLMDLGYHDGTDYGYEHFSSYPYIMPLADEWIDQRGIVRSNLIYDDIIRNIPNIVSQLNSDLSVGQIELDNVDGEYDYMLRDPYVFHGHGIHIYIGEPDWTRDSFIYILDGVIESISAAGANKITLSIRDKKENLNVKLQENLIDTDYFNTFITAANTNGNFSGNIVNGIQTQPWDHTKAVLPEATENVPVPIALGRCFNAEPVLMDSYNHIYKVHEGLIQELCVVRSIWRITNTGYKI